MTLAMMSSFINYILGLVLYHGSRGVIEEDEKREAQQKAEQDIIDQEALRFTLEEKARNVMSVNANVHTQESFAAILSDRGKIGFRLGDFEAKDNHMSIADGNADLRITGAQPIAAVTPSADKGKQLTEPNEKASHEPQDKKKYLKEKLQLPVKNFH
ncbi:hypothetical protein Tco_0345789 [Tanacetum coccineum]